MAKPKRKQRKVDAVFEPRALPTPEQLASGEFVDDFITQVDSNTKAKAFRRTSLVERWMNEETAALKAGKIKEEDRLWPEHARRFMGDCLLLWQRCGGPRLTALYGERITGAGGDGMGQKQALDELHRIKGLLGVYQRHYWAVFEAVLRHDEPAGVAGSKFANNPAQRQQSAKLITSMVAIQLATRLGY